MLSFSVPVDAGTAADVYVAKVLNDPAAPTFRECRTDNETSAPATAFCAE